MRRIIANLVIALGLGLVGLGRKLDKPSPPAAKLIVTLPRRRYRPIVQHRRRFSLNWFVFTPACG